MEKEEYKNTRSKHWWIFWVSLPLIILFFASLVYLYINAEKIMSDSIRNQVEKRSNGIYTVSYNNIDISLLNRSFTISDFKLLPHKFDSVVNTPSHKKESYYSISTEKISLHGFSFWQYLSSRKIMLEKFIIEAPELHLYGVENHKRRDSLDIRLVLQKELNRYFDNLLIHEFRISHAVLDINGRGDESLLDAIGSTSVVLYDLKIHEDIQWDTSLFFSEKAEIFFHNVAYNVEKISHNFFIDQIHISTFDNLISIENVRFEPENTDSVINKYLINIPEILLKGTAIDSIITKGILIADRMILKNPGISIDIPPGLGTEKKTSAPSGDILITLPEELSFIKFNKVLLHEGSLRYRNNLNKIKSFIHAGTFTVLVDSTQFDSVISYPDLMRIVKSRTNFTGEDVSIEHAEIKHRIHANILNVSTRKQTLISAGIDIKSIDSLSPVVNGSVENIELDGVDVNSLIEEQALIASFFRIDSANLHLRLPDSDGDKNPDPGKFPYFQLDTLQGIYNQIAVDFSNRKGGKFQADADINYTLLGYQTDTTKEAGDKAFNLRKAFVKINDLTLIKENDYLLHANKLNFNSEDESLISENITHRFYETQPAGQPEVLLKQIKLTGIDMQAFLERSKGKVGGIVIEKPVIRFGTAKGAGVKINRNELQQKIGTKVTSVVEELAIQHLDINELEFQNVENEELIQEKQTGSIFIDLRDIHIAKGQLDTEKPLYSEDINISVHNYRSFSADGTAEVSFDEFRISRSKKEILIKNFLYQPLEIEQGVDYGLDFYSRQILFSGFEVDNYYFENRFYSDNLLLGSPVIIYHDSVKKIQDKPEGFVFPDIARTMKIEEIQIDRGELGYFSGKDTITLKFDLTFKDFDIQAGERFIAMKDPLPVSNFTLLLSDIYSFGSSNESRLYMDTLSFTSTSGSLYAAGIQMHPKMEDPLDYLNRQNRKMAISFEVPTLSADDVDFNEFYFNKNINLDLLQVGEVDFRLFIISGMDQNPAANPQDKLPAVLNQLNLDMFQFDDMDISIVRYADDSLSSFSLKNISGKLDDFYLDRQSSLTDAIIQSGDLYLFKDRYQYHTSDSMYILSAENVFFSTGDSTLGLESFKLTPRYPRYRFSRELGYQTDRAEISGNTVLARGVDFKSIFDHSNLLIQNLQLEGFDISLFRDKRVAFPAWHRSNMPQKMLRELPFSMDVEQVEMKNFEVSYAEMVENARNPGEVFFTNMNASLSNVTNIPSSIEEDPLMRLKLKGYMLSKGKMDVLLKMHLDSPSDTFSFYGSLSSMHLPELNSLTRSLFGVAIKKGRGRVDTVMIFGNKDYELGQLVFPYQKFRIQMVDPHTGLRGGIGDGIMTFLANNILLKSNNPRAGQQVRIGTVFYKRNPRKSIFNFLWKGIMSGIESTMGYNIREQKKEIKAFKKQLEDN